MVDTGSWLTFPYRFEGLLVANQRAVRLWFAADLHDQRIMVAAVKS